LINGGRDSLIPPCEQASRDQAIPPRMWELHIAAENESALLGGVKDAPISS
jgi:hypothetical protein